MDRSLDRRGPQHPQIADGKRGMRCLRGGWLGRCLAFQSLLPLRERKSPYFLTAA